MAQRWRLLSGLFGEIKQPLWRRLLQLCHPGAAPLSSPPAKGQAWGGLEGCVCGESRAVCRSDCLKARTGSVQHAPPQRWSARRAERPAVARGARPVGTCARSLNTEAGGKPKAMSRTWAAEQCHGGLLVACYIIVVSSGRVLGDSSQGFLMTLLCQSPSISLYWTAFTCAFDQPILHTP